jgi:hypothetical protein
VDYLEGFKSDFETVTNKRMRRHDLGEEDDEEARNSSFIPIKATLRASQTYRNLIRCMQSQIVEW